MIYSLLSSSSIGESIFEWIDIASMVIELLAVVIIVVAIFYALGLFLIRSVFKTQFKGRYESLKVSLGRSLLLGLEILVAADIVRTVALEATLQSVLALGFLVVIRTFLSWALVVEIEGRWPWQPEREEITE